MPKRPTSNPAHYLTPGERRSAAKKAADAALQKARNKAVRAKATLSKVAKATTEPTKTSKAGLVIEKETLEASPKEIRDLAANNIVFQPNEGPQTAFLAAPEDDVLYGGAAGGGKSAAMIVDPLRYAHIAEHRALILRKTMPELRELIDQSRVLYPKAFPGVKFKETEKLWVFPSGAQIEYGFLEKDSDVYRYQGRAYSWIGFDEITHLATEFPWNYLSSRLRTTSPHIKTYMRATANPGNIGHAWVKARYIDPAPANTTFYKDGISRKFIPAKLSDNPYLFTDGRYEKMLKALPELHRRRLLEGDWDISEGAAFPEFSKNIHVIDSFVIPKSWTRVKGIDYGYSSPSCCLWAAINPDNGCLIIYKELYERGLDGEALAMRISMMEQEERNTIPGVLDGSAWDRRGYSGPTIGETLTRPPFGHKLRPADKNRIAGKVQLHQRLRINDITGMPGLLIFSTCQNLIREISTIPISPTNSEDVDTHADDHAYDALRYLVMSRPRMPTMDDMAFQFKTENAFTPLDAVFGW